MLLVTDTQPGGTFAADWPTDALATAHGVVKGLAPVPIPLSDGRLPLKVLLVVSLPDDEREDCACDDTAPRAADPADLTTNPAAFSQDMGGTCVDLTTPNRVVEEFAYFFVVRTSEPEIRGTTLGTRRVLPPVVTKELLGTVARCAAGGEGGCRPCRPRAVAGHRCAEVPRRHRCDPVDRPAAGRRLPLRGGRGGPSRRRAPSPPAGPRRPRRLGRGRLGRHADDLPGGGRSPTATSCSSARCGAPTATRSATCSTRCRWRRARSASSPCSTGSAATTVARTERLDSEEQLDAFAERDRDISEIVGSHLDEESSGGSRSNTWGVAGGIGAGFIGSGFGIFGGVAGGAGGSSAQAWQDNARRPVGQQPPAAARPDGPALGSGARRALDHGAGRRPGRVACAPRRRRWPTTTTATR